MNNTKKSIKTSSYCCSDIIEIEQNSSCGNARKELRDSHSIIIHHQKQEFSTSSHITYEEHKEERRGGAPKRGRRATNVAPLTNYKKDVDKSKKYGISQSDLVSVKLKIQKQNDFLEYSYLRDKITGNTIMPLKNWTKI